MAAKQGKGFGKGSGGTNKSPKKFGGKGFPFGGFKKKTKGGRRGR